MSRQVCSPRIVGRFFVALAAMLLSSTLVLAHNPQNSDLADNPAVTAQLQSGKGKPVQLDGDLEIVHQDFPDGHGRFVFTLKQPDGTRVPMRFAKHPPTQLLTGNHVRANGQILNGNLLLYSGANVKQTGGGGSTGGGTTTPSIPVPNTFGTQSVLIILVNFQDYQVTPYTTTDLQNLVLTISNSFFFENSYQQASLAGSVVGWYTIPDSITTCNATQIATDAKAAATSAGVNLSNYTRYVYFFPYDSNCGFAGASDVGGNPSESWINGTMDVRVVNHELGHAFGLWHSHFLDCGTTATICSNGSSVEYGDLVDTMGYIQTPSPEFNAFQKERLGWLNYAASPSIQTVSSGGTYTIKPYELGGSGPNALKILKSADPTTGAKTWYYLEARQAIGFDAFLSDGTCSQCYTQNETNGILFHLGTDGDGNSSELIDMTPATVTYGYWWDPSLVVGQSFSDSTAGVTFTPTAVSGSGATVQITIGGSVCTASNPTVSVSPSQSQSVSAGTPVSFTLSIKDNDSSSCAPAMFSLSDYLPSGWSGVLSTPTLYLSPGKSGSATVTATSPQGTANGYYNVGVGAANASANTYNGSANATYVVSSSATQGISVTASPSTVSAGQTVALSVTVLASGAPLPGAGVTVSVTPPTGRTQTMTGATGSNGVAAFTYKLGRRAAPGMYQVQANITSTMKAASAIGASTSFTVQ